MPGATIGRTVADVERDLIIDTLHHCLGNRTHAANILGISIRTLRNKLKHYCVLPINIPANSEERIVWHLRRNYNEDFSTPAHSGSQYYRIDDLFFPTDRAERGGSMAPTVRFVEPAGPEGIGKGLRGNIRVGPVSATVGQPVTLTLEVKQPTGEDYPEVAPYTTLRRFVTHLVPLPCCELFPAKGEMLLYRLAPGRVPSSPSFYVCNSTQVRQQSR